MKHPRGLDTGGDATAAVAELTLEYGPGRAHAPVGAATVVREMTQYCRQTVQC
jgi:hypothetical protein